MHHVLPRGFVKVRHYGLLANAQRQARLTVCRRLPLVATVAAVVPSEATVPIAPAQPRCCQVCGATRLSYRERAPVPAASSGRPSDSS